MGKKRFSKSKVEQDFSNRSVVIMLVVVVVVSALSLGFYLNILSASTASTIDQLQDEPSNLGQASIAIVEPPLEEREIQYEARKNLKNNGGNE